MKRLIYIFCLLAASAAPALADSLAQDRAAVLAAPNYRFTFDASETRQLLAMPLRSEIAVSLDGKNVALLEYLGVDKTSGPDGPLLFLIRDPSVSKVELSDLRRATGEAIPVVGTAHVEPGSAVPAPGPGETGGPALGGSDPSAASPAPGPGSGSAGGEGHGDAGSNGGALDGYGKSLGHAADAGLMAGIGAGILHGVIDPPSSQRARAELEQQINEIASQTEAERQALLKDLNNYDHAIGEALTRIEAVAASHPLLPDGAVAPSTSSNPAFAASEVGHRVDKVRSELANVEPADRVRADAKEIALQAADGAEAAYGESPVDAHALAEIAETFADFAVGLDPITGVIRNGYEVFTGQNLITGRELSTFERTLAGAGFAADLATLGIASSVVHGLELTGKWMARGGHYAPGLLAGVKDFASYAKELGVKSARGWTDLVDFTRRTLGNEVGAVGKNVSQLIEKSHLGAWAQKFDIYRIQKAESANLEFLRKYPGSRPPYRAGTDVIDGVLRRDQTFVRLHGPTNAEGTWVMSMESIDKSLAPSVLREKYSLKYTPTAISEVTVREGTLMRRSKVGKNFGGAEGAVQYEIMDPLAWNRAKFGPVRPLGN